MLLPGGASEDWQRKAISRGAADEQIASHVLLIEVCGTPIAHWFHSQTVFPSLTFILRHHPAVPATHTRLENEKNPQKNNKNPQRCRKNEINNAEKSANFRLQNCGRTDALSEKERGGRGFFHLNDTEWD